MPSIPETLEQLITERQDGHLSAAQLAEVERAIATNAEAAHLAQRYARLSKLLIGFRALPPGVDLAGLERAVSQRVSDAAADLSSLDVASEVGSSSVPEVLRLAGTHSDSQDASADRVDDLLRAEFRPLPAVDWDAFGHRISSAVHAEASRRTRAVRSSEPSAARHARRLRWLVRGVVPLAAAAMLLIALRPSNVEMPDGMTSVADRPSLVSVSIDRPSSSGRVVVTFDRSSPPVTEEAVVERGGIIIATTGAAPHNSEAVELALLF